MNARAAVHTCFAQNLSVHQLSQRTLLAGRGATHLNSWCSLELRILEENLSASLSKLREYSSSISALRRKNSCRSCSSWMRDSDCCSKHLNCSTSWLRISGHWKNRREVVIMGHMTGYNAHIAGTRPECLRCEKIWVNPRLLLSSIFQKRCVKNSQFCDVMNGTDVSWACSALWKALIWSTSKQNSTAFWKSLINLSFLHTHTQYMEMDNYASWLIHGSFG